MKSTGLIEQLKKILYPAMEDNALDIVIGKGAAAKSIRLDLPKFTLIGATTRVGLLTAPLRDRFGVLSPMEFYEENELKEIVTRSSKIVGIKIEEDAAYEIARRSRGTPRIANRILRRVRDYCEVKGNGIINLEITKMALELLEIDEQGFDRIDNKILEAIIYNFDGGPVGLETLSYFIGEELDTIQDVYEPYLLQKGFIIRMPRGRKATEKAYKHFKVQFMEQTKLK
jgi:Holliday junction resolvasome, helicase subunit